MTLNDALVLIYCGIEDGYRAAKQECEISIDDLADLIDGDFDSIGKAMEILTEQMGGNTGKKQKAKK
jgi:DNA-binding IscR family transcriptional regulator